MWLKLASLVGSEIIGMIVYVIGNSGADRYKKQDFTNFSFRFW
jgi:hypothetical protein